MSDKTEEPTPRRLRKAREEGDSGASAVVAQAVAFVVAVALVPAAARAVSVAAIEDLKTAIDAAAHGSMGARLLDPWHLARQVLFLVVPFLAAVGVAGGAVQALQTGGIVSAKRLTLKLDRLNPLSGIGQIFSWTRLLSVFRSLLASVAVSFLAWQVVREHVVDLARTVGRERWIGVVVSTLAASLAWRAAFLGLVLGGLDVLVVRWSWRRRLRMSPEEIKREHRDAEGDPHLRAARDRAYQEVMAQTTLANVRNASVVVVNPTHLACALRYDASGGDAAPVVVASGEGAFAARIVHAAREAQVPIVQNVPLARALVDLSVGDGIPEVLYEAVAEILREIHAPSP